MGIRSLSTASISTGVKRSKVWDQSAVTVIPAFEAIQTISTGGSSQASIDFTSIPSTYKHLQIRYNIKGTAATNLQTACFRFNNTAGTGYTDYRAYYGVGFRGGSAELGLDRAYLGATPAGNANASFRGSGVITIYDYADTSKYKMGVAHHGYGYNDSSNQEANWRTVKWESTSAINQVTLFMQAGDIGTNCMATLYGIKG